MQEMDGGSFNKPQEHQTSPQPARAPNDAPPQQQQEPSQQKQEGILAIDDLVMMIGLREVRIREEEKKRENVVKQANIVIADMKKTTGSLNQNILQTQNNLKKAEKSVQDSTEKDLTIESLRKRILQLETQVENTARERDAAKKECNEAVQERDVVMQKLNTAMNEKKEMDTAFRGREEAIQKKTEIIEGQLLKIAELEEKLLASRPAKKTKKKSTNKENKTIRDENDGGTWK